MINTREIAEEYRLSYWAGIMQDRQKSGLSIKVYCKSAGFHENVYYYWQRKLHEAAHEGLMRNNFTKEIESNKPLVPNGWALCKASEIEATDRENVLAIEIGPCRIIANQNLDPELLLKVCRVLVQL